ncbi:hypothetical protein [Tenacibaculum caenipelagi]|uniref:Uncharacterized protein n=1 Tax=Tenacibaculum caenipelagi TaxID=1325435 RepID=A0A4R6THN0_9FLAO|nr:hypothetical protein [Tenacibaculum caenipelagi]TDQ29846.1 hypothetical protein DFQ07_0168 [Tenacibaculum caenipelagi]
MRTLKIILLISMLTLLTTSCTDLTEDIVPNNTIEKTELINSIDTDNPIDDTGGDGGEDQGTGKG